MAELLYLEEEYVTHCMYASNYYNQCYHSPLFYVKRDYYFP